jgi:hypothetical protein
MLNRIKWPVSLTRKTQQWTVRYTKKDTWPAATIEYADAKKLEMELIGMDRSMPADPNKLMVMLNCGDKTGGFEGGNADGLLPKFTGWDE